MSYRTRNVLISVDSLKEEMFQFAQTMVRTPSLPGEEQTIQSMIAKKLKDLGLKVDIVPSFFDELKGHPAFCNDGIPFRDRINVVGQWKVSEENASRANSESHGSLILNGHVDVVTPGNESFWRDSPWSGRIIDGKLYGRGSCDMKSGLASAIFAIEALRKAGLRPLHDILLESVIGEETGGVGTLTTILKGYQADAVVILEPTGLRSCPIQSGALTFRITIKGQAVHACMKNSGVSAIEKFYIVLNGLNSFDTLRHSEYHSIYYDDARNVAPLSIGTIRGGNWHSTIPDEVIVEGRYGVFPGESVDQAKERFVKALNETTNEEGWLRDHRPTLEWFEGQFESGETDLESPIVKTLNKTHKQVTGLEPTIRGVTYGSDLRLFVNYAKMPAILYGPGNVANAHTVNEYIELEEVLTCAKVIALTICQWCGVDSGR